MCEIIGTVVDWTWKRKVVSGRKRENKEARDFLPQESVKSVFRHVALQVRRGAAETTACEGCLEEDTAEVLKRTGIEGRQRLCSSNHVGLRPVKLRVFFQQ